MPFRFPDGEILSAADAQRLLADGMTAAKERLEYQDFLEHLAAAHPAPPLTEIQQANEAHWKAAEAKAYAENQLHPCLHTVGFAAGRVPKCPICNKGT